MECEKIINTTAQVPKFTLLPGLSGCAIDNATTFVKDSSIVKPIELVDGLIHRGTKVVIAAPSKAGKTCLLLELAVAASLGQRFLRWATVEGKVLLLNLEIPPAFMKERLAAVMEHFGVQEVNNLDIWNLRGKTANQEALVAQIIKQAQGKNYGLIIIDPIYKLMVGRSENGAGGVGALCHHLERIAEKTGAAVVYSHHFTKGNSKNKSAIDRPSGSGVFARDPDTIITLSPHTEADCYTVETCLRNCPPQASFVVERDYPVMVEREDLDPEDVPVEEVGDPDDHGLLLILKVRPHSTQEWELKAGGLGLSRSTFFRVKRKLKDSGHIKFDFITKTWMLAETAGTGDTTDTGDTIDTGIVEQVKPQ